MKHAIKPRDAFSEQANRSTVMGTFPKSSSSSIKPICLNCGRPYTEHKVYVDSSLAICPTAVYTPRPDPTRTTEKGK